jgi:hypothetical protein
MNNFSALPFTCCVYRTVFRILIYVYWFQIRLYRILQYIYSATRIYVFLDAFLLHYTVHITTGMYQATDPDPEIFVDS